MPYHVSNNIPFFPKSNYHYIFFIFIFLKIIIKLEGISNLLVLFGSIRVFFDIVNINLATK